MPDKATLERARDDAEKGKSPSTQAGEFVREEIDHIRRGIHGARSTKQAIAIGLSKARRAGVKLPVPKKGTVPESTRVQAARETAKARKGAKPVSPRRSRAATAALQQEGSEAASPEALSRHAKAAARRKS
jgi:Family of unknown function (DUF6496)